MLVLFRQWWLQTNRTNSSNIRWPCLFIYFKIFTGEQILLLFLSVVYIYYLPLCSLASARYLRWRSSNTRRLLKYSTWREQERVATVVLVITLLSHYPSNVVWKCCTVPSLPYRHLHTASSSQGKICPSPECCPWCSLSRDQEYRRIQGKQSIRLEPSSSFVVHAARAVCLLFQPLALTWP